MPQTVIRWKPSSYEKAPLLCRIFGHYWENGWYGDRPYLSQSFMALDGLNILHLNLTCTCDRCGAKSVVGYTHWRDKTAFTNLQVSG